MPVKAVPTYDVLKSLGFAEHESTYSAPPGGLIFDFGDFAIEAIHCLSMRSMQHVVLFTGVAATLRVVSCMEFEMPQQVDSVEQGAAWLTYRLDYGGRFTPARPVWWIDLGRENQLTLPWLRRQAEYAARPQCLVRRDWARVGLRELAAALVEAVDSQMVEIGFDGEVLKIHCPTPLIAMPALGKTWSNRYKLPASSFWRLPKRLMLDPVPWAVWESALEIGGYRYPGIVSVDEIIW